MKQLLGLIFCAIAFAGCEKYNNIDNSGSITIPYSLYVGGVNGSVHKTNNGIDFDQLFLGDGVFTNALIVADTNIIMVKNFTYTANGLAKIFNPIQKGNSVHQAPYAAPSGNNGLAYNRPNTTLYFPGQKSVYVCGTSVPVNVSTNNGITFTTDAFKGTQTAANSIAQLSNGNIFSYNNLSIVPNFCTRTGGLPNTPWVTVVDNLNDNGGVSWILSAYKDTLMAFCKFGLAKPRYTVNSGTNWTNYTGLPDSCLLTMAKTCKATNQFYVCLDKKGLYRLNGTRFEKIPGQLPANIRAYDIVGKRNTYRSGGTKDYMFLATDQGLYMSETNGDNWFKVHNNPCSALY
jgi:hypothetical protein